MANVDPRRLRPAELARLLNSTSLGEVASERLIRQHRTRAGFRIGDGTHLDLVRYVAWLVTQRHRPTATGDVPIARVQTLLADAAAGLAPEVHAAVLAAGYRTGFVLSSQKDLAELFGEHEKTIDYWFRKRGAPRCKVGRGYEYDLADILPWYVRYKAGDDDSLSASDAKRRKLIAEAAIAEMKEQRLRGELVPQREVEQEFGRIATSLAEQLTSMVAGVVPMLAGKGQVEMHQVLAAQVNRFLNEFKVADAKDQD